MNKSHGVVARLLISALFVAAAISHPAIAQEKKAEAPIRAQKVWIDNDKVRVTESTFKPGEANPMQARGARVTRVLKGTTKVLRTYSDGKTETVDWKQGDVLFSPANTTSSKNVGKSSVVIFTVTLK
jgi:mannose-6-phosphate isomerase-like protein (cupin superfamily)